MQINMPSKWRITANIDEDMLRKLEIWAEQENRSISSLAATILREAIRSHDSGVYLHSPKFPDAYKGKKEKLD